MYWQKYPLSFYLFFVKKKHIIVRKNTILKRTLQFICEIVSPFPKIMRKGLHDPTCPLKDKVFHLQKHINGCKLKNPTVEIRTTPILDISKWVISLVCASSLLSNKAVQGPKKNSNRLDIYLLIAHNIICFSLVCLGVSQKTCLSN